MLRHAIDYFGVANKEKSQQSRNIGDKLTVARHNGEQSSKSIRTCLRDETDTICDYRGESTKKQTLHFLKYVGFVLTCLSDNVNDTGDYRGEDTKKKNLIFSKVCRFLARRYLVPANAIIQN